MDTTGGAPPRRLSASLNPQFDAYTTASEAKPAMLRVQEESHYQAPTSDLGEHKEGIIDMGWDKGTEKIPEGLIEGIRNEDMWLLIRRFTKQIFHVKVTHDPLPGGLDLVVSEDEQFSPNKLRAQLERMYVGPFMGILKFLHHVVRLRSWREPRRTGTFCLVYFIAWYFNVLALAVLGMLASLVLSPQARRMLFPPAPLSLVDWRTGGLTNPPAGVFASHDSATGAPEHVKGEAVENEANNFVTGIVVIATNTLTDKDPQHSEAQKGGGLTAKLPDPNELATKVAIAKDKASGVQQPSQDKTKSPMEQMMWSSVRPLMHGMTVANDCWERSKNLLEPPTLWSRETSQRRLATILLPLLISSTFVSSYMVYKASTFFVGILLFGDPFLQWTFRWLRQEGFSLDTTIFKDIPTDAQVALALLRKGEAQGTPIPTPPGPPDAPDQEARPVGTDILDAADGDLPLGATDAEIRDAAQYDSEGVEAAGGGDHEATESGSQGKTRHKLLGLVKGGARAAAKTVVGVDAARAKAGRETAKNRRGAASQRNDPALSGPIEFQARYNGKPGCVYLTTDAGRPSVCFCLDGVEKGHEAELNTLQPVWVVPVAEIAEINKYSGYGAKSKLMAGWALERKILDGVEIIDVRGEEKLLTAIQHRDELFNRLCSMGQQKWQVL